jgi:hypothetical protein
LPAPSAIIFLATFACAATAQDAGALQYSLKVHPTEVVYHENGEQWIHRVSFTFTVLNSAATAYAGSAPSCELFDVEVFQEDSGMVKSIWKWSSTQKFCDRPTPIAIQPGQKWHGRAVWKFKESTVEGARYKDVATFIPSHESAAAPLEVGTTEEITLD